jgi:NAD(P)-dependent dehydrogenase (short-subunit alcohol dehydrogenase family)
MPNVSYDFSGRTAIVTGGASGIGRAIALRLREAGADVIVWDAGAADLYGIEYYRVDVTDTASINDALAAMMANGARPIDILSNNAGFAGATVPTLQADPAEWRRIVEVNLTGTYECCRHVVPHMLASPAGRIVNMASLAGKEGTPNASAYSASKAGVIAFTKSLAKELAATAVRVNSVAPAAVDTPILQQVTPEFLKIMIDKSPLGRLGTVEETAELVLWLCSDACSFNTGACFDLSGGRATY